jgi:pantothenate kinase type III
VETVNTLQLPILFRKKLETNKVEILVKSEVLCSVPDPESGAFVTSWLRSGMNTLDHISESLEQCFGLKIRKFFYAGCGSGI